MNWQAFYNELEKIARLLKVAEPPPPRGMSLARWDRILGGKKTKGSSWEAIGPAPRDRPFRPKRKHSSGYVDDIEGGDPMHLMPALRAIHKFGAVKENPRWS